MYSPSIALSLQNQCEAPQKASPSFWNKTKNFLTGRFCQNWREKVLVALVATKVICVVLCLFTGQWMFGLVFLVSAAFNAILRKEIRDFTNLHSASSGLHDTNMGLKNTKVSLDKSVEKLKEKNKEFATTLKEMTTANGILQASNKNYVKQNQEHEKRNQEQKNLIDQHENLIKQHENSISQQEHLIHGHLALMEQMKAESTEVVDTLWDLARQNKNINADQQAAYLKSALKFQELLETEFKLQEAHNEGYNDFLTKFQETLQLANVNAIEAGRQSGELKGQVGKLEEQMKELRRRGRELKKESKKISTENESLKETNKTLVTLIKDLTEKTTLLSEAATQINEAADKNTKAADKAEEKMNNLAQEAQKTLQFIQEQKQKLGTTLFPNQTPPVSQPSQGQNKPPKEPHMVSKPKSPRYQDVLVKVG